MALYFNGAEIPTSGDITFGGISFNEVRFNGITFWQKGTTIIRPDAPSFCSASDNEYVDKIRIMWGYSSYKAGYAVYRSTDDIDYTLISQVANGDLYYDDYNVIQGIAYYYKVKACWLFDEDNCSDFSETDTGTLLVIQPTPPPTTSPQNFTASDGAYYDKIVCSWSNGSEADATSVNIYRDDALIDNVPFGVTSYSDHAVDPGSQYEYYAKFLNKGGEGPESARDLGSTLDENIYVLKSGDTMTGHLFLNADGTENLHAVTYQQYAALEARVIALEEWRTSHTSDVNVHSIAQVTNLQTELDSKPTGSWSRSGETLHIDIAGS